MYNGRITTHFERPDPRPASHVVYWMQQSQRMPLNHALAWSIETANRLDLPLVVCFGITDDYPDANLRHYHFMVEGLVETARTLAAMGIPFKVVQGPPPQAVAPFLEGAAALVMDKGYLRHQRQWRQEAAALAYRRNVPVCYEVESDLLVPVETVSSKEEYAARTLRPKIWRLLGSYAEPFAMPRLSRPQDANPEEAILTLEAFLKEGRLDRSVPPSSRYRGGYSQAVRQLEFFLSRGLHRYKDSNSPAYDFTSKLSLYLHYGQISPLDIYERVNLYAAGEHGLDTESLAAFLEQLVVRRELAFNFVYYRESYDAFETMTYPWAYETMAAHAADPRPYTYSLEELASARTHDPYWNAAMKEMAATGYMHNYMRMYWCKKLVEWSPTHKEAYERAVHLNNRYFIDGRDPNSYVGIAWCFGLHDHGWQERPVFGKLRYMNDKGLVRKFDMEAYIRRVDKLAGGPEQLSLDL